MKKPLKSISMLLFLAGDSYRNDGSIFTDGNHMGSFATGWSV